MQISGRGLEGDGLAGERWSSSRVLENSCTVLKVEYRSCAKHPASVSVDVLDVVENSVDQAEGTVVVKIVASGGGKDSVSPHECSSDVVERLLERDQASVVGVVIGIHLICASTSITTTAPLDGTSIGHGSCVPIVSWSTSRADIVELDRTGVVHETISRRGLDKVGCHATDGSSVLEVGSLGHNDLSGVVDVSILVVDSASVQPNQDTLIDCGGLTCCTKAGVQVGIRVTRRNCGVSLEDTTRLSDCGQGQQVGKKRHLDSGFV